MDSYNVSNFNVKFEDPFLENVTLTQLDRIPIQSLIGPTSANDRFDAPLSSSDFQKALRERVPRNTRR